MPSQMYLVQPVGRAACLRQAVTLARAVDSAAREFPAGVETVRVVRAKELAEMAAAGTPLPLAARRLVAAHRKPTLASKQQRAQKERLRQRMQMQAEPPQRPGQRTHAPYQLDLFDGTR